MNPPRAGTGAAAAADPAPPAAGAPPADQAAREVWARMCDLVLDNERRREVADAVGLSFGRIKAIRRVARRSMSMRELADELGIDPPNATVVVDDLESLGLARRQSHPTDRRAKVVEATPKGREIAKRANAILSTPPPALGALEPDDLEQLGRILAQLGAPAELE
jgi:DNA-binding MarR family transcriptional regulator